MPALRFLPGGVVVCVLVPTLLRCGFQRPGDAAPVEGARSGGSRGDRRRRGALPSAS
jgi:hypothetical protein